MPSFYTYILSSLPMLSWQVKPAINREQFLGSCRGLLSQEEFSILEAILEPGEFPLAGYEILRRWFDFETALRNELVKLRASRRKKDPSKYVRQNQYWDADIIHAAMAAYKNTSILEAEKILDQARWDFLNELSKLHYFDFESLIVYAFRLKILKRWEEIDKADKEGLLEASLN